MKTTTGKIIMAAMFASLCCVATMLIKVPTPPFGYINMGDVIVVLSGFMLSPVYGFLAAAVGSSLADLFLGYFTYAPVTFVIKGVMALIAYYIYKCAKSKMNNNISKIVSSLCAEIFMVLGYYVYEGILYGFIPSLVNIPLNSIQGLAAVILGTVLAGTFEKHKIKF